MNVNPKSRFRDFRRLVGLFALLFVGMYATTFAAPPSTYPDGVLTTDGRAVYSPYHLDKPAVAIKYDPPPPTRMLDPYDPPAERHYFIVPQYYAPVQGLGRVSLFRDVAPRWVGTAIVSQTEEDLQPFLNSFLDNSLRGQASDPFDKTVSYNSLEENVNAVDASQPLDSNATQTKTTVPQNNEPSPRMLRNDDKGQKKIKLNSAENNERYQPEIYLANGWQSADVYKDVDKTSEAGLPATGNLEGTNVHRTPIWYSKAGISFDGIGAVITYIQSDDKIIPRVSAVNDLLRGKPLPARTYYNEFDASLNYTYPFRHIVDGTIGYNLFAPLDRNFYGTNIDGEAFGTITATAIPYLRPNVTFSLFNSAARQLRGKHIEMRLDTVNFARFNYGSLHAEFDPFVSLGVDDGLVGDGVGFSAAIIGIKTPIQITDHVIFTANANYGLPINESGPNFRTDVGKLGVWGGIAIIVKF